MLRLTLAGSALLICAACVPVQTQRGYLPDPQAVSSISVGTDTKTTIAGRLGNPSTTATFGNEVWYYISSKEEQLAFFTPRILARDVLAVEFNKEDQVADVRRYGLKDGRIIAFVSRETPTRGRELTLIQQMFNALPGAALPKEEPKQQGR
jgi:outer membrane protein assembly factor BamE (lipoprotein component of BamABCDE complex)